MALKTVNATEDDARALISKVDVWRRSNLTNMTNVANGPKTRLEMATVQSQAQSHLDLLTALRGGPGWASLSADVKNDVTELIEDMTAGLSHLNTRLDPATMFATLPDGEKSSVLQHARLSDDDVAKTVEKLTGAYRANGPQH
jgi:hypothetical protein